MKNSCNNYIISGVIGAVIVVILLIVFIVFVKPIDFAPVYMLNPEKALSYNDSIFVDSVKCIHLEVLSDLENKGILLNPNEYTSHVVDYYNTLIAFLLGLFGLLSLGTIFSIKYVSKKEIEEIRTDITNHKLNTKNELKEDIVHSLNELMRDSISFKESCIKALYGRIEDELVQHEDIEIIDKKMHILEGDIQLLFEFYDNLEEEKSSKQDIE